VELEAAGKPKPGALSLAWLAHARAMAGRQKDARAGVAHLDALARKTYVPPYHLAIAHTGLGDHDSAFALLTKALVDRDPAVTNVGVEPRFEPLRRDKRYHDLMTQLGIPATQR
jgi:hypothetical protein